MNDSNTILQKIKEPQILLSLLYAAAVGIGMIFNHYKFIVFGINIFDYASLTDFLLAPFSDLKILYTTVSFLILCFIFYFLDEKTRNKFPQFYNLRILNILPYKLLSLGITFLLFVITITYSAKKYGINYYKNISKEKTITIHTKSNIISGKYLGKTGQNLFVYKNNEVKIIPITSNINFYLIN